MSEQEMPICPKCEVNDHVVLVNTVQKAGTAVGGATGAIAGYVGAESGTIVGGAIGSVVPVVGTGIGVIAGGISGAIFGFFTGSAIGNRVGKHIDTHVIGEYRCNKCGTEFEV